MTLSFLPYAVAAWLFVIGLWGVVSSNNLVRTVLSLTVVQSATYIVLLGIGYRSGGKAPIVADIPAKSKLVDPVVQVLVLTDVVIEATITALAGARDPGPQALRKHRPRRPAHPPALNTSVSPGRACDRDPATGGAGARRHGAGRAAVAQ